MNSIKKICIIGGSGSGKTTLAYNLSKELGISSFHIDGAHHTKNWKVRDKNERDEMILRKVSEPEWIIDGTYLSTMEQRVRNADLVIFLDYSAIARLSGAVRRFVKNHGKEKPEIPGCKEKLDWNFIKLIFRFKNDKRPKIIEMLKDNDKVLVFGSRRQLNKWFKMEFNKKMEMGLVK